MGFVKALKEDYICSTYCNHIHALRKGVPARQVMSELFSKSTGWARPSDAGVFGDGTCNNGQFLECLDMEAANCPRNLCTIGMDHFRATSVLDIWKKREAFVCMEFTSMEWTCSKANEQVCCSQSHPPSFKKYLLEERLASEAELEAIKKKIEEIVEDAVEFVDALLLPPHSQLLENVCGLQRLWNLAG
ncbi:hypothetical protein SELMODRAFT_432175 [Selaginella moellendorffii]|uniref:Uncharacterized protein n=1 Tax=Selaginella moellendorffii TaxID=88036 RepID=D8TF77_SELML|nr:hypothetical protein SELMODRAFT_432175 [Selaginella moellendorffii]